MSEKWKLNSQWQQDVLRTSARRNESEEDEKEFLSLVDRAFGECTIEIARILMKTFSVQPDYGTQESVVGALMSAGDEIFIQAILEELPRLIREAPEHAEDLLGIAVERNPEMLKKVASQLNMEIRNSLRNVLQRTDFLEFHPEASQISV